MTHLTGSITIPGPGRPARGRQAWRRSAVAGALASLLAASWAAQAADAKAPAATAASPAASAALPHDPNEPGDNKPPVVDSGMSGALLKLLLLAEFENREGRPADAIELYVQVARELKNDQLFRRGVEIAVQNAAGDKALEVAKAWRQAMPGSLEAVQMQVSLLFALDRVADTTEPLRTLLTLAPAKERAALIATLPRAAGRAKDKAAVSRQFEELLKPWMDEADTRVAARVALARLKLAEGQADAAMTLAWQASDLQPGDVGVALLGLELMSRPGAPAWSGRPDDHGAEALVRRYLATPQADPVVRQALAAHLVQQQRIAEAADQIRLAAQARPDQGMLWLSLGELEIELRHPDAADAALHRALDLALAARAKVADGSASAPPAADGNDGAAGDSAGDDDDDATPAAGDAAGAAPHGDPMAAPSRLARIHLMLARSAQLRHDDAATARWLAQIPPADQDLPVRALRAELLAKQGKLSEARKLVQSTPADTDDAKRLRLLTEVQLLREHRQLGKAREVLASANAAKPDDVDLLYEQAMIDERLDKLDEMEKLLRRVIQLQPDHAQAMNALGYSLADRHLRLDEALQLVMKAHQIAPADPFIVDSLGWIEFRRGNLPEATRWLRQAYTARNDTEIAAHLGEALWAQGDRDEALKIFGEARRRDADNEVLRETMRRLKANP